MEDIRQLLALWQDRSRSSADVKALALAHASAFRQKAQQLDAMRAALERLAADRHGGHRPDCPILDDLQRGTGEEPATDAQVEAVRR